MSDVAIAIYVMAGVHLFEFSVGVYLSPRRRAKIRKDNEMFLDRALEIGRDSVFAALQKSKILLDGTLKAKPRKPK